MILVSDTLRSSLYPLGFVASFLFGLRFIIQWLQSENKGESYVTPFFWKCSLTANGLLLIHSWIQLQYPVFLIQALNGFISWRNLNLESPSPLARRTTLALMCAWILFINLLFFTQGDKEWMRPLTLPWKGIHADKAPFSWHALGLLGMVLFASRFWIQWVVAEKHTKSFIGESFWWISVIGASIALVYFIRLFDFVNIIGYGMGMVPYLRNIQLIRKKKRKLNGK